MAPGAVEMTFAEKQLAKYGWKKGMGLGKMNDGISVPIKVKTCQNNLGIGNDPKKHLSHWWDMAYNRAVNNIVVERSEKGNVEVKSSSECSITQEKPNLFNTNVLYDDFQQAGTLKGIQFTSERRTDSDSENESRGISKGQGLLLDMTDAELLKLCGGGTAHKGARHGIRMGGKMKRLKAMEEADAARFAQGRLELAIDRDGDTDNRLGTGDKVTGRERKEGSSEVKEGDITVERENYLEVEVPKKKKKKSKKGSDNSKIEGCVGATNDTELDIDGDRDSIFELSSNESNRKHMKTIKREREDTDNIPADETPIVPHERKNKKKRRHREEDIANEESESTQNVIDFSADSEGKKKKNKHRPSKTEHEEENINDTKRKKKNRQEKRSDETPPVSLDVVQSPEETSQKKKKRKKPITEDHAI